MRNTKQKKHIISILKNAKHPLSINEIYNRIICDLPRIAKSTIYRNIDLLLDQNLIEKHHLNDNEIFYLYKENDGDHTHYVICDDCEKTYNLPSCPIEEIENYMETEGFIIKDHQLHISGVCKDCASHNK